MKNYSISTQKKSIQAYKKEYFNYLENKINSLYTYLHYYNPEWRLLEDGKGYYERTNTLIDKSSIESHLQPNFIQLTVWRPLLMLISKIEIKKNGSILLNITFNSNGNFSQYVTDYSYLDIDSTSTFVCFSPNNTNPNYGSFYIRTSTILDCDEIVFYTPTGAELYEKYGPSWGDYYKQNKIWYYLSYQPTGGLVRSFVPNAYIKYNDNPDDHTQDAWTQQFSYSLEVFDTYRLNCRELQYRWGYKNTSDHVFWYGPNYTSSLNIGATIYKKDAYDVPSNWQSSDLDHYILFEASLAQYVTWTLSTGVDDHDNPALIYNYHISNELDFGLVYNIQIITSTPRYFYKDANNTTYHIKYNNNVFDTTTLFDYTNINVEYKNKDEQWEPTHLGQDYQHWSGGTELFPQTVYELDNQYEDIIADSILYETHGNISTYKVSFDKTETNHPEIEDDFEVIFS